MSGSHPYSDKQAVDIPSGLEHHQPTQITEFYKPRPNISSSSSSPSIGHDTYKEASHLSVSPPHKKSQATSRKRICGLAVPIFWIVVAAIGAIVAAAVVGGIVGASTSGKHSSSSLANNTSISLSPDSNSSGTSSSPTASSSNTTTTGPITSSASRTSSVQLTTTAVIGPSTTLLSDCPSSNNTLYQINSAFFRKFCSNSLQSSLDGSNVIDTPTESLDDCIALCNSYNIQSRTEISAGTSSICNAVCWRATIIGDDFPGKCFGFTTQNSSNSLVFKGDTRCDSAAWINQSF